MLGAIDIVLIILLFVALFGYIEILRQSGVTAAASIHSLTTPLFIGGVIVTGMALPLVLLVFSVSSPNIQSIPYFGLDWWNSNISRSAVIEV